MENGKEFKGVPDEASVGLSAASPRPVTGSGLSASIPHAGCETETLCDRMGFHVFKFAGDGPPSGWPCECGATKHEP